MTNLRPIGKLLSDRRAGVAVEYGFLLALIVVFVMIAVISLAGATMEVWTNVSDKVARP